VNYVIRKITRRLRRKISRKLLRLLTEVLLLIALSWVFAFPYRVSGRSMECNYFTGDRVIVSHICAWLNDIKTGSVVLCNLDGEYAIKRMIALPGDKVKISDGSVYINDTKLDEDYLSPDTYTGEDMELTLAEDEYFVLGDNRCVSKDSRQVGPLKSKQILGIVIFKI
jgi:signal peptidase I